MKAIAKIFSYFVIATAILALAPIDSIVFNTKPSYIQKMSANAKNVFYVFTKKFYPPVGGTYYGEMSSLFFGVPHGEGMWLATVDEAGESITYKGQWQYGEYHGQGTLESSNGFEYVGEFKDGDRDGKGSHTTNDGDIYVGEFKNDEYNGQGTLITHGGGKYVGQFKDGRPNGEGILTSADGDIYEGQLRATKPHGQGTFIMADGQKIVGEWKDGEIWNGTVADSDGKIYRKFTNGKYKVVYNYD